MVAWWWLLVAVWVVASFGFFTAALLAVGKRGEILIPPQVKE